MLRPHIAERPAFRRGERPRREVERPINVGDNAFAMIVGARPGPWFGQFVGKPRSTDEPAGSGQRVVIACGLV